MKDFIQKTLSLSLVLRLRLASSPSAIGETNYDTLSLPYVCR